MFGTSWLACALANSALRDGHTAYYASACRPVDDLVRGQPTSRPCKDLLDVIEDRAGRRSSLIASQLPVDNWHAAMVGPALAEAPSTGYWSPRTVPMKGPSMRRWCARFRPMESRRSLAKLRGRRVMAGGGPETEARKARTRDRPGSHEFAYVRFIQKSNRQANSLPPIRLILRKAPQTGHG